MESVLIDQRTEYRKAIMRCRFHSSSALTGSSAPSRPALPDDKTPEAQSPQEPAETRPRVRKEGSR